MPRTIWKGANAIVVSYEASQKIIRTFKGTKFSSSPTKFPKGQFLILQWNSKEEEDESKIKKRWFSIFSSSSSLRRRNTTEKKILIEISDRQKMADAVDVIKLSLEKLYLRQVLKLHNR